MKAETKTAPPLWELHRARLASFNEAQYNFDPERAYEYTTATGWHVDDYATDLPPEAPGPPAEHGSWTAARQVLLNYTFPPPDLITGIFVPDDPLEKRTLLLRGQFLFFTFWFGVRVGGVFDETRTTDTGPEQVWGYNYRTLEGHFERGEINFTVHKHLQTGRVEFRIHAYSQLGRIRNPFYWLGFKLFGRMLQRRFARESMRRMREQVEESLAKAQLVN
ncbi:DUF1990 domain-containing protein [Hymenobacter qilianensis]|uniref:DUF1990 domain-containing protein n=2 Tax=Hymenobacter qilianensis TaxID=1385715 RepID=A0ACB5PTV4_9BACT|nr:DUF1990 domain-containing protein [Hymenobacter qilianensis]QNP52813.1 DUF1990 domain-containing protein [Hymenobacter qilianensis]GGF70962.1 DUF1990 domain-containing protein [Hymenobacter qilianensis]